MGFPLNTPPSKLCYAGYCPMPRINRNNVVVVEAVGPIGVGHPTTSDGPHMIVAAAGNNIPALRTIDATKAHVPL